MEIHTWVATDASNPAPAIAMIRMPMEGGGGKGRAVGMGWLPVWFQAPSEDEARARAQKHWDDAVAKAANAKPRGRPKMEKPLGDAPDEIEETV